MCGISGFSWDDRTLIQQMNHINRHRGPDDAGVYSDEFVSLGHTRLSILDLSPKGHQPMTYGELVITYNGEVYNYREIRDDLIRKGYSFSSDCDTEVILKAYDAYGTDCFSLFDGMWALCIYDNAEKKLILSRDIFGIKPLYYYYDNKRLIFSSMIGAILCHNIQTTPNNTIIMDYLAFNLLTHTNETFYKNILCLNPGCLLEYNLETDDLKIKKYYVPSVKKGTAVEKDIYRLFDASVRNRTLADVKIGSCLSGGVDSSSITCLLDRYLPESHPTFSLIVPGFKNDESKYIKEIGRYTDTVQYTTELTPAIFLQDAVDFIQSQEEPVTGVSPFCQYEVMKLAASHGIKVLLDGQGGDELFGGYDYYFANYFYELFSSLHFIRLFSTMRIYYRNRKSLYPHMLFVYQMLPLFVKRVLCYGIVVPWINKKYHKSLIPKPSDIRWEKRTVRSILNLSIQKTAIPHLLSWEDKNAMRWSIESRPPFLDKNLYEYSLSLSTEDMIQFGETKRCFKRAMKDVLPKMISGRKDKIGFAAPSDDLFRDNNVINFTDSIIYSDSFKNRPYWDYEQVVSMYEKHKGGELNIGDTIWKWINLEIWLSKAGW